MIVEQDGEESWAFGITPFWFETFWERVQDVSLLRCKFGDMYLRNFLRSASSSVHRPLCIFIGNTL